MIGRVHVLAANGPGKKWFIATFSGRWRDTGVKTSKGTSWEAEELYQGAARGHGDYASIRGTLGRSGKSVIDYYRFTITINGEVMRISFNVFALSDFHGIRISCMIKRIIFVQSLLLYTFIEVYGRIFASRRELI